MLKLDDTAIAQIAKVLQVAILTGTDVVDHLRQIEFDNKDGKLCMTDSYSEQFRENLEKMMATIAQKNTSKSTLFD